MSPPLRITDWANAGMLLLRTARTERYCWLNQRDVVIVKVDRQEPLVVVRLALAAKVAKLVA